MSEPTPDETPTPAEPETATPEPAPEVAPAETESTPEVAPEPEASPASEPAPEPEAPTPAEDAPVAEEAQPADALAEPAESEAGAVDEAEAPTLQPDESAPTEPVDATPAPTRYTAHPETLKHLAHNYSYHVMTSDQEQRYQQICAGAEALALLILESSPGSREQLLALTKLDEVVLWSREAITRNEAPAE